MDAHSRSVMTTIHAESPYQDYFKDVVRFRELFYFLAWRDILVRYRQAVFGIAWAVFRPLMSMIIFSFLFGRIAHLPSDNVNYALFVLAGMLPWQFFANGLNDLCQCIVVNSHLISKVYFPRVIIPMAQVIIHLVDFAVGCGLLMLLGLFMGGLSFLHLLTLPLFILLMGLLTLGIGFWLSALTVQYRDFRLLVPFFVQFGMFISPVGYGTFVIPEQWRFLYALNPMVGVIDGFRWAFFGISYPDFGISLGLSVMMTLLIAVSGFFFFRKMERRFADVI